MNTFHKTPHSPTLDGEWEGEYFELDWSKNKAFRVLPITLGISASKDINEQYEIRITITDSLSVGSATYGAGSLNFIDFKVPVRKQYTDYPNFTHLMMDISNLEMREVQTANGTLLIARINATYPVWQERANPGFLILKKKNTLSQEAQNAFAEQAQDFIRIYPNPFSSYFLANFDLSKDAHTRVTISNYYNTPSYHSTVFEGYKSKGNHTLEINTPPSRSGSYLISIEYNGKVENKIIIKN